MLTELKKRFEENSSLVGYIYHRNFSEYSTYQEDLFQEGYMGLWKACVTFDETKSVQFSTYACTCIKRTMLTYIQRFILKHTNNISFDSIVSEDGEGRQLYLSDVIGLDDDPTERCFVDDCIQKLPELKKTIIQKLIEGYTQDEVAELLHISQTSVCRCLNQFRKILLEELHTHENKNNPD